MKTGFDGLAETYDVRIAGAGRQWTVDRTVDSLKAIYPLSGTVCDLGCGTGLYTRALEKAGCTVIAADFSLSMLSAAKRSGSGRPVCADCRKPLPFEDGSFDVVTSFDVLTYVPDLDAMFLEAKRVLKTGGLFFSVVPNAASLVRMIARTARWGSYAAGGPKELNFFRKKPVLKQVVKIFGTGGVTVVRPVPGFASGVFTQAPSLLKPLFFMEHIGLGLLLWGKKS
jgi:ubiquinone/menaquinone biosynthesis C-methylase UbiE